MLSVQKLRPLPDAPGLANSFIDTVPDVLDLNAGFANIDRAFTDRNRLSGSYTCRDALRITLVNALPLFDGALRPHHVLGVPIRTPVGRGDFRPLHAMTGERGDLFLNASAFAVPEPYTFGAMGVFLPNVRGFSSRNENLSVMRRFRLAERWRLEFRGEFFNAFNRRNLLAPSGSASAWISDDEST